MAAATSLRSLQASRFLADRPVLSCLLPGREVALADVHLVAAVVAEKVDGAEGSVGLEVGGFVDERVLTAELVLDVLEADGHLFDAFGVEGAASGGEGDLLQGVVPAVAAGTDVGADGVDDGLGALAFLDRVVEIRVALVVVSIGDEHDGLAHRFLAARGEQLVATGAVDSIEERGAAAGTQGVDTGGEQVEAVGPILLIVGSHVEAHNEGLVRLWLHDLEKELNRCLLLELEARADGGACVDDNANTQGQVGLLGKAVDALRSLLIVKQGKVALLEVADEVAVMVGDAEDQIDFVDLPGDGELLVGIFLRLAGSCRRRGLCRRGLGRSCLRGLDRTARSGWRLADRSGGRRTGGRGLRKSGGDGNRKQQNGDEAKNRGKAFDHFTVVILHCGVDGRPRPYSVRSASMGSRREARQAGTRQAMVATASKASATSTKTMGSRGWVP